jgi:cysteine synthase A
MNLITTFFPASYLSFQSSNKKFLGFGRFLMVNDGLFIGSSSAMNCVGAVRVARLLGPGHVICTILCDGGARHLSKFHNPGYLAAQGLTPSATSLEFLEHNNGSFKSKREPLS